MDYQAQLTQKENKLQSPRIQHPTNQSRIRHDATCLEFDKLQVEIQRDFLFDYLVMNGEAVDFIGFLTPQLLPDQAQTQLHQVETQPQQAHHPETPPYQAQSQLQPHQAQTQPHQAESPVHQSHQAETQPQQTHQTETQPRQVQTQLNQTQSCQAQPQVRQAQPDQELNVEEFFNVFVEDKEMWTR